MTRKRHLIIVVCTVSAVGFAVAGLWLRPWSAVGRIHTDGITSYYVHSGTKADYEGKLPAIIIVGHPLSSPTKDLSTFKDKFDEPVLLIWSGLVAGLGEDCPVDDGAVWARKRQQFLTLLDDYKRELNIDESRIYLTGFSAAGVYAWMLAYDRPELYAGVAPMSATSYPHQIQENLESAKAVITVFVRGEKDDTPPRNLAAEMETGRILDSYNPHSRFVLKKGKDTGKCTSTGWRTSSTCCNSARNRDMSSRKHGRGCNGIARTASCVMCRGPL